MMGWNNNNSLKRIDHHLNNMGGIEVEKIIREPNLETLVMET